MGLLLPYRFVWLDAVLVFTQAHCLTMYLIAVRSLKIVVLESVLWDIIPCGIFLERRCVFQILIKRYRHITLKFIVFYKYPAFETLTYKYFVSFSHNGFICNR